MLGPGLQGFIPKILATCEGQFPKTCSACGLVYRSFHDYIKSALPIGVLPEPHSIKDGDPLGFLSLANCICGTTVALRCEIPAVHKAFSEALRSEAESSGRTVVEVLTDLRDVIRAAALLPAEPSRPT